MKKWKSLLEIPARLHGLCKEQAEGFEEYEWICKGMCVLGKMGSQG